MVSSLAAGAGLLAGGLGFFVLLRPRLRVLLMELKHHEGDPGQQTHRCITQIHTHTHTLTSAMNSRILVFDTSVSAR